jgi:YebC/PmpR family DNA-binding regulatory protein
MSGHSKWSTIKHKKAANDKVKGSVFTKMAKGISIAVKKGSGVADPDMNFALRLAIDKARSVNMPRENIDRAIDKGIGKGGDELSELTLEGFAPEGVAMIIEAVTDNSNRTVAEMRSLIEKQGGVMGVPGSVSHLFERCGIINFQGTLSDEDELMLIDKGLIDLEQDQGEGVAYTSPTSFMKVVEAMKTLPLSSVEGALGYRPKLIHKPTDPGKVQEFLEIISDNDDVQEVYAALA